jgi:hypothetical protein
MGKWMKSASICVALLYVLLAGCAPATKNTNPRDADLLASIRKDQKEWRDALAAYSTCTQNYDETMIKTPASAGEIADGAALACHAQLSRWASFKNQERSHVAMLNRGAATPTASDPDQRDAQTDEQIAAEFIARTRPAQIDYIQQLRNANTAHPH